MEQIILNIANDYTKTPGGRHSSEGKFSGEDFREKMLIPYYEKAKNNKQKLVIILDGGYGYAPSFLEEAFGGLARKIKDNQILSNIEIISDEEPKLIEDIKKYILEALKTQR